MDNDQGDQPSRILPEPAPAHVGRTTLLHWAIFVGLMTALIGGAAILF